MELSVGVCFEGVSGEGVARRARGCAGPGGEAAVYEDVQMRGRTCGELRGAETRGVRVLRCVECAACGDVMARHGLCRLRTRRSGWWKRGGQGSGGAEREAGTEQAGRAATTYSGSMGSMGQAGRKGERVDNEDNSE